MSKRSSESEVANTHICEVCDKVFRDNFNLHRHMNNVHDMKISAMNSKQRKLLCEMCCKEFRDDFNLHRHLQSMHKKEENFAVTSCSSERVPHERQQTHSFFCEECNKDFRDGFNLQRHVHTVHEREKDFSFPLCPLCSCKVSLENKTNHLAEEHNVYLEKEILHFDTVNEFSDWKEKMERDTVSKFVKHEGSKKRKDGTIVSYFYCHRDGYFSSKGKGKRSLKCLGSNKMGGHCPAHIIVKEKDGITAEYVKTHLSHSLDLGRLTLTPNEKKSVATKLAMNISLDSILDEIRNTVCGEEISRVHLICKKDLHNIVDQFNLNKEGLHANDHVSVDAWVRHMEETSSLIRLYKPQGEKTLSCPQLEGKDFCLILANDAQLQLLRTYGNDVLCIDGTHGLNAYNFQLFTILVLDDMREGFPCAFMFSNRSDSVVMELFFRTLLSAGASIEPKYFMSDMAEAFFNGWSAVKPDGNTQQLFCSWHVDKAWRQNLKKIPGKERQVEVYKMIKTLMMERDHSTFDILSLEIRKLLFADADTRLFAGYLEKFLNDPRPWACCHRLQAGINTNMHLENLHRSIKYIYLQGTKVRRLDKAIHALMRLIQNKMFDRLITLHKGKVSKKLSAIRDRHTKSLMLSEDSAQNIGDGNWIVTSSSGHEIYNVQESNKNCDCSLRCGECSACIHMFLCSCHDAAISWNMCKHCHLICRKKGLQNIEVQERIHDEDNCEPGPSTKTGDSEKVTIVKEISKIRKTNFETRKAEVQAQFMKLLEMAQNEEEIEVVEKQIAPIESIISSLRDKRSSYEMNDDAVNEPSNKKICPQRKFFSTKQSGLKSRAHISKPSEEESLKIAIDLINRSK